MSANSTLDSNGLTKALVERCRGLTAAGIPDDASIVARQCLLDWLGVILGLCGAVDRAISLLELLVFTAVLCSRFRVVMAQQRFDPEDVRAGLSVYPRHGIKMRVVRREPPSTRVPPPPTIGAQT